VSMARGWPAYRIKAARESGLFVGISNVCFSGKRSFNVPLLKYKNCGGKGAIRIAPVLPVVGYRVGV